MKLYTVRHGQTEWNRQSRAQGRTDVPLNELVVKQAVALREKTEGWEFDVCYSSPLVRAVETARIVVDGRCEILYDERLVERCFGEFEGEVIRDWGATLGGDGYDRVANLGVGGLEPVKDLLARAKEFLDWVVDRHNNEARVLVVAHGGLLKALHYNIVGYDDETDFWEFELGNGELVEYEV